MPRYKNFAEVKSDLKHYKDLAEEYSSRIRVMISRARDIRVKNTTIIEERDAEIMNLKMVIQRLQDEKISCVSEASNKIIALEDSLNSAMVEIHTLNHTIKEYNDYFYKITDTTTEFFVKHHS